jgi:hypothetical protein
MTSPPLVPACPIVIEMVQYTPRRDGMTVQVSASDPTHPLSALIGQSRQIQTRQRAVAGDDQAALADVSWTDDNVEATTVAYWAALGVDVTIAPNYLPGDAPKADAPVDTPPNQDATQDSSTAGDRPT